MRTNAMTSPESDSHRYKAVLRISEAIAACREPEELATTLTDEIGPSFCTLITFTSWY